MTSLLTLPELLAAARERLQYAYSGPADRRALRFPDRRSFRYYAARGLVPPPVRLQGRVGLYDESHLNQLVAIKRLQEEGKTLDQIGEALAAMDAEGIARAARPRPAPAPPSHRAGSGRGALDELHLDAGLTLSFEPPLRTSRRLRRQLERASRALVRSVRAVRSKQSAKESRT